MSKQTAVVIGAIKKIEGYTQYGGGRARKTGAATALFAANFFDIGFMTNNVRISVTGGNIEVTYLDKSIFEDIDGGDTGEAQIEAHAISAIILDGQTVFDRNRSEKYIAIKGVGSFIIEAW